MTGEQYADGEFIPFTLKKNYVAQSPSMEFPGKRVTISINSLGLRGPEATLEKPSHTKRILFLGDSYTFGVYCNDDEVYPRVLERLYAGQTPRVEVLNAGYADGWSPDEHYAWLVNRGLSSRPDLVVYGFFIGNDIDGINTSHYVSLDKRRLPTRIVNPGIWIDEVVEGKPFEVWDGHQLRDFTYVDDAADAFLMAAASEEANVQVFNLGGDCVISLKNLADLLVEVNRGGEYIVRSFPPDHKRIDIGDYYADFSHIRSVLGWEPKVPLGEALAHTLVFYQEHLKHYL